jgi:ferredoxin-thioredoxin reductase catalytic subunit
MFDKYNAGYCETGLRKTEKGNFSENSMCEAVLLLEQGMSIQEAATEKGVKYQTLSGMSKKRQKNYGENVRMKPHYDCCRVFTSEQEKDLASYILVCSKMYYGLTSKDCRHLANEMATVNLISCPTTWKENQMAGIDWFMNFMSRYPRLTLRSPEECS